MKSNTENPDEHAPRRFEPWPTAIVLFFLVVFAADATMVLMGINSWPGLVTDNHYKKGLEYNQVIHAQTAQDQLGWSITLNSKKLVAGRPGEIAVTLTDRENRALQNAQVEGILFRPVGEGHDLAFLLREEKPGIYSTSITPPKPGAWDVKIRARKTSKVDFRYVERITISKQEELE
jgi:nitrogen fixation protein FixH